MILHLLESRRVRRLAAGALTASVGVHLASVSAASRPPAAADGPVEGGLINVRYLLPPDRVQEPVGERVRFVPIGQGSPGWTEGRDPTADVLPVAGAREPEQATRPPVEADEGDLTLATALFTEDQVDSAAVRDPSSGGPSYPDVLREQGVQGEVVVEFAVDTTGHADTASFAVVQSSHPLFTEAVRESLPRMLFTPALAGGRRVRQLVRLPMKFRLMVPEKGSA